MDLRKFFADNEKVLVGAAAIATIGAMIVTIVALWFTGIQLGRAGEQLQLARKNLEASMVYQMQKDARSLHDTLFRSDPQVEAFIYGQGQGDKAIETRAELAVIELIQFYTSVFNQHRNGVITDTFWPTFDKEMCRTVGRPKVKEFWDKNVRPGSYSDEFKAWGDECLKRPSKP